MITALSRVAMFAAALVVTTTSFALAETSATPAPKMKTKVAQTSTQDSATAPLPTPNPLKVSGFFRSYYFTRQNASNNPGVNNGKQVNQATLNQAIDVHADYHFAGGGWYAGGSYFLADPFNGPCATALDHAKGMPCVSQKPPNTNPDDTVPDYILDTFPETYLGYSAYNVSGKIGNQLFVSPWAAPYDATRLKPAAYQGADVAYTMNSWTFEAADMIQFEGRTANNFSNQTLLTSFPAGNPGMAANIFNSGGKGINTSGFTYVKAGYAPKDTNYAVNGYYYFVSDLVNTGWFDGKYTFNQSAWKPYVALQGGYERNTGASYIGNVNSSVIGVQLGANVTQNVLVTAGFDSIPWHSDSVSTAALNAIHWKCNTVAGVPNSTPSYQLGSTVTNPVTGKPVVVQTLAYFLPVNAAQCLNNANGTTTIYYGGWASPYTDGYATDPLYTTSISQGMVDRRAPGTSWKVAATFTSNNKRVVFFASDAWYNYGNALAGENTSEWNVDGTYRFSPYKGSGAYKGLMLRERYMVRTQSNTFYPSAAPFLGGLPLFKYNRAQLEYDF